MSRKTELVSSRDIEIAKEKTKKALKTGFAIGCYNSETDNEIGRSKEHAKHMRRTRRQNFARKMNLIDPHYGKKAAGILAAGTALGLAATTLPGVGAVAGPVVGGGVIASGLAFLETDAHRAVGDHAILDSLLDDRDDNWRTNVSLHGYDGHGDTISEFDRQQMLAWSDSDSEEDLDNLLPPEMSNRAKANSPPGGTTNNPLFDSTDSDTSSQKYPSMENLGLFDSTESKPVQKTNIPRPPSPDFGSGQRTTNPHSSAAVQKMGNAHAASPNLLLDEPTVEDDFFSTLTLSPPLQPTKNVSVRTISSDVPPQLGAKIMEKKVQTIQQTQIQQPTQPSSQPPMEDFFADFSGSSSSNNGSFFSSVAKQIPSTTPKKQTQNMVDEDPFADLYSRPTKTTTAPASNYSALQGMRNF